MRLIHVAVKLRSVEAVDAAYEADFLVDTGTTDSMAPASELQRICVGPVGRMAYKLADGSVHEYEFGLARIEFMGEVTAGRVLFGPNDVEPLLGVTALESAAVISNRSFAVKRRVWPAGISPSKRRAPSATTRTRVDALAETESSSGATSG